MLEKSFRIDEAPKSFNMEMKMDSSWTSTRNKIMIVIETVDGSDLHAEAMASTPALPNAIRYARKIARTYRDDLPEFAFAVVNFNARRHLHLKGQARAEAEAEFKTRYQKLVRKLKPTHILFSGNLSLVYPVEHAPLKNGWVHEIENMKVTSTLDFGRLMEKQGEYANLLGFWCRHLANLMIGYLPHDLSKVKAKPVLIDTLKKFDKVCALWDKSKRAALDTETKNLSVTSNAIYTMQLAFAERPLLGFVIPIDHPHEANPFSEEERQYIKKELRSRFGAKTGPELVTFNGIFDLRIVRQALNLPIIYLDVWEIMAGEHLLDENISSMASIGIKAGGLAAVYCSYGNDFYLSSDTTFSKEDRSTVGSIPPDEPGFLMYCFPPTVLVGTEKGDVEISQLSPGDKVWSLNHVNDELELKAVAKVFKTPGRKRMVKLTVEGQTFTMTEDHPVWSDDRNDYVPAGLIRPGERLRLLDKSSSLGTS